LDGGRGCLRARGVVGVLSGALRTPSMVNCDRPKRFCAVLCSHTHCCVCVLCVHTRCCACARASTRVAVRACTVMFFSYVACGRADRRIPIGEAGGCALIPLAGVGSPGCRVARSVPNGYSAPISLVAQAACTPQLHPPHALPRACRLIGLPMCVRRARMRLCVCARRSSVAPATRKP
jgi:hypothetical protein